MGAPAGGKYDFKRDVLDPKPDLVTIEFVNDAFWKGDALKKHYTKIRELLQGNGSEIILITPHFVRPDWMGVTNIKFDDDPRPYVQGLREFARENRLPVADASLYWGHLWREGIPYMTLLGNSINHPDERGHRFFADALMGVFPKK
jgi:lysophospholipase L1-like esterase